MGVFFWIPHPRFDVLLALLFYECLHRGPCPSKALGEPKLVKHRAVVSCHPRASVVALLSSHPNAPVFRSEMCEGVRGCVFCSNNRACDVAPPPRLTIIAATPAGPDAPAHATLSRRCCRVMCPRA